MQKQPTTIAGTWPPLGDLPILERAVADTQLALAGQRVIITASARDGARNVLVHPHRVLFDMQTGIASEILRTAAGFERRILVGDHSVTERVSVAPADAAAVWCWRASEPLSFRVAWRLDSAQTDRTGENSWRVDDASLIASSGTGHIAAFVFSEEASWVISQEGSNDLAVEATLTLPADSDVWLAMASGRNHEEVTRTLGWLHDAARVPIARAAAFRRHARDHLRVTSSEATVARVAAALVDRVTTSMIELPRGVSPISGPPSPDQPAQVIAIDACTIAGAAAAIGDSVLPRSTLRFLHAARTADGLVPSSCYSDGSCGEPSDAATAAWLSLAASYHAWSGDDGLLRELWPDLADSARRIPAHQFAHTFRALAITAESLGDAAAASDFRRAPAAAAPAPWAIAPHAPLNVRAAHHLLKFAHHYLGLEPDAPRGRLRARLNIPERWQHARIDNIRLADARITIELTRTTSGSRIIASPTAGAIPIRLILEPVLPRVPRHVTIDGNDARLDLTPHRNRIIAPVQIELDHARTVDFTFET